jgi:hypothetical protein
MNRVVGVSASRLPMDVAAPPIRAMLDVDVIPEVIVV